MIATPACRHEPGDGPCPACGATAPEAGVCLGCSRGLRADSRFCSGCGTPVTAPERKPVTVLFVGASGTAAPGDALDPERWHAIVDGFLRILEDRVRAHGGVIDRFTGEGIKAHFGAPVAREGHAIAACRAALDIARDVASFTEDLRCDHGVHFSVRMGLHSGEVVYGPIESTLSAQGRTAAVAARIEQLAGPGSILVSAATAQLVGDRFALRDLGSTDLRGAADPVRVFEIAGPLSRRKRRAAHGEVPPFVGRDVELGLLEALLHRPDRAVVAIVGEAGVGKTRLVDEFLARAEARGAYVHVRLAAHENEIDTPFAFYRRALRRLLGVEASEDVEAARERAAGRLLLVDPTIRDELPRIFDLLGLARPGTPAARMNLDGLHAELAAISGRLASLAIDQSRPRIAVFDDFHWIDSASLDVLVRGFEEEFIKPNLAIFAMRSGTSFRPASLPSFAGSLHLRPLEGPEVDALVDRLLGPDPSVAKLRDGLRERCGGNPFFLVEMLRSLRAAGDLAGEAGATRLLRARALGDLPPTLAALLAARVDALSAADRRILRVAATIGDRFEVRLLTRASGQPPIAVAEALRRLRDVEIVEPLVPGRADEFRFRHRLVRESALRSMLSDSRARLHAAVADAIEEGTEADRQAAVIASHRQAAGDPAAAARWRLRAAAFAVRREPGLAIDHLREAERLLGIDGSTREDRLRLDVRVATLELGWRHGLDPGEAGRLDEEGRRLAERLGDARSAATLAAGHAAIRGMSGDLDRVAPLVEASRSLADGLRDRAVDLSLRTTRALALYAIGDLAGVLHECSKPLEPGDLDLEASAFSGSKAVEYLTLRGTALVDSGRLAEGREVLDEAVREARASGSAIAICSAVAASSLRARLTGASPSELLPACVEGLAIAEHSRNDFIRSRMLGALGEVHLLLGRHDEAAALFRQALAIFESDPGRIRDDFGLLARLAGCLLVRRDPAGAIDAADRALAAIEGQGGRLREIEMVMRWAWVHAAAGRTPPEKIEGRVREAMATVSAIGAWSREPFLRLVLAWVHRREGRAEEAATETRRAHDDLEAMGYWDTKRIRLLEGMRERLPEEQRRLMWGFLADFGIAAGSGPALLP